MIETALISIVDDDESIREAIQSLLRSVGFRAKTFASAEQFLQFDQIENTACLILDVRMPGMSGLELQRRLMATQCHIPIVFVTAHGDEEVRSRALQEGAVEFLLKPFSEEALLNAIQAALHAQ